jgi:predicted RNA binding protein YcfA (HicA-like mRNA interferase family)
MPRKVRDLIRDLKKAGFVDRGGKGSHRNFVHPKVAKPVAISGKGERRRKTLSRENCTTCYRGG